MPEFEESRSLRVFLCHANNDKIHARQLSRQLRESGFDPWLDEEKLLGGDDWEREIRRAIRSTDVVLVCLSKQSLTRRGFVQREIAFALDIVDEQPEGRTFLIPLRLEECDVPDRIRKWHWVDMFASAGYDSLMRALRKAMIESGLGENGQNRDLATSPALRREQARVFGLSKLSELALEELTGSPRGANWCCGLSAFRGLPGAFLADEGRRALQFKLTDGGEEPVIRCEQIFRDNATTLTVADGCCAWAANLAIQYERFGGATQAVARTEEDMKIAVLSTPSRLALATKRELKLIDCDRGKTLASAPIPNDYTNYSFDTMWFTKQGYLITGKYGHQAIWGSDSLEQILDFHDFGLSGHYSQHNQSVNCTGRLFAAMAMPSSLVVADIIDKIIICTLPISHCIDLAFHPTYENLLFGIDKGGQIFILDIERPSLKVLANDPARNWQHCFWGTPSVLACVAGNGLCGMWRLVS